MTLTHFNDSLKINNDSFVWRYMSFPKIFDLVSNNHIYFSRLDVFDDPLEGINANDRFKLSMANKIKLGNVESDSVIKMGKAGSFAVKKEDVKKWQEGIFSSCWHLTEKEVGGHHESLAMWELYADKDSFAIKIPLNELLLTLSKSLNEFEDDEITNCGYGKVSYQSLGWQMQAFNVFPSLIKDISFKHENELRFLLLRENLSNEREVDRKGITLPLTTKLSDFKSKIEILAHPDMDINVFETFKPEFKKFGFDIAHSLLLTRKVVNSLIE